MLTIVMAGGRGERLLPLTRRRAKPVVPFADGTLIDFTLRNCERSGLNRVVVVAQYQAESIERHLARHWAGRFSSLSVLTPDDIGRPLRGTADAVRAVLANRPTSERLLVLAADHVYEMSYRPMIAAHRRRRADATIGLYCVPRLEASRFGVARVDASYRVRGFLEKPLRPTGLADRPSHCLASMGIYVFERAPLARLLAGDRSVDDFGHEVLPGYLATGHTVVGYTFGGDEPRSRWLDIADVDAYHGALMDLYAVNVEGHGVVERSVLGPDVAIGAGAEVVESVLLEGAVVGADARLRRVVVEEGVVIPPGAVLGYGETVPPRAVWPDLHESAGGVLVVTGSPRDAGQRIFPARPGIVSVNRLDPAPAFRDRPST